MLPEMLRGQVWSWHLNPQGLEYELLALMGPCGMSGLIRPTEILLTEQVSIDLHPENEVSAHPRNFRF